MPDFFTYCPSCKSHRISKNNEKHFDCPACGFVYFHNVAAACALIIEHGERLLFTVRKYDPAKNMLDLPGGFVDYNENVEDALKREVREELNLVVDKPVFMASFPNIYNYKNIDYYTLDFIFKTSMDSLKGIEANDDVKDYRLVKPEDINLGDIGLISIKKAVQYYLHLKNITQLAGLEG